ncbi:protein mab-21-like 3 [Nematostella vectensis]|uniref:protein mab-21-like 3 n=1 Tax=Nematostella vectensis TaxID=45351 RepID=UPI002076FE64|nr:protein mab-21-like 3 [Nematostella vectensis]
MADRRLKDSLEQFLKTHYDGFAARRQKMLGQVKTVLEYLLQALKERDNMFDFEHINSATFFDVKTSNTVEVLLNVQGFDSSEKALSIEDGQAPPGFAVAKVNSNDWYEWCVCSNSGKKYLSSKLINEKLLDHISKIVKLHDLHIHDFSIDLEHSFGQQSTTLKLNVLSDRDNYHVVLVPTIPCPGRWTYSAHAWQNEGSHWPNKTTKQAAIADGIHLIGRSSHTKSPNHWQIAFLLPIRRLLADKTGCKHKCAMVMRILLENSSTLQEVIAGNHLENVLLHLFKKFPVASFWDEDRFGQRFLDIVNELDKCVRDRHLADFFIPDLNLFNDIDKHAAQLARVELQKLTQNPVEFLKLSGNSQSTAF